MFKKGSKIELIKEMGVLDEIGMVCTIQEIDEYGNITFDIPMADKFFPQMNKCVVDWKAMGNMSIDEAKTYFKEYVEKKEVEPFTYFNTDTGKEETTFSWTKWMNKEILCYDLDGFLIRLYCKYRYNHRKLELRCYEIEHFADLNFKHCLKFDKKEECLLKTHASCNCKLDDFSLKTGLKLATYRLICKYKDFQYKNYLTTL